MIHYKQNLYLSDDLCGKADIIKWNISMGKGLMGTTLITLSKNPSDLFDIIPGYVFKLRSLRKQNMCVVGIAGSRKKAMQLVMDMIDECIKNTGSCEQLRPYFENRK